MPYWIVTILAASDIVNRDEYAALLAVIRSRCEIHDDGAFETSLTMAEHDLYQAYGDTERRAVWALVTLVGLLEAVLWRGLEHLANDQLHRLPRDRWTFKLLHVLLSETFADPWAKAEWTAWEAGTADRGQVVDLIGQMSFAVAAVARESCKHARAFRTGRRNAGSAPEREFMTAICYIDTMAEVACLLCNIAHMRGVGELRGSMHPHSQRSERRDVEGIVLHDPNAERAAIASAIAWLQQPDSVAELDEKLGQVAARIDPSVLDTRRSAWYTNQKRQLDYFRRCITDYTHQGSHNRLETQLASSEHRSMSAEDTNLARLSVRVVSLHALDHLFHQLLERRNAERANLRLRMGWQRAEVQYTCRRLECYVFLLQTRP